MNPDLDIDTGGVRECAAGIAATGARVRDGAARAPVTIPVPRWSAGEAATVVAEAARQRLAQVGDEIAEAARQIVAAVLDYESADDRAADRLREVRPGPFVPKSADR
jgi:hypothetical protein